MITFNENSAKIPLKTKLTAHKAKKDLKKQGFDNFLVKTNNNGDIAILGYKTPKCDELVIANIIKADGKQTLKTYHSFPQTEKGAPYGKIIEVWDKVKDSLIFNKRVTVQYRDSKTPEVISTMYSDANCDDGVVIINKFPAQI
ncbi:hypothetical protein IJD44_08395 [bacterium]|nr:hypothetical protein [bacterium]